MFVSLVPCVSPPPALHCPDDPGHSARNLNFVGTLPDVNTFRVSAKDLDRATNFVLTLPGFMGAVNESLRTGKPLPKTSVVINVLYDEDFTAHGSDPNGTLDSSRPIAKTVNLDAFGVGGLFSVPVRARARPLKCWMLFGASDVIFPPCPPSPSIAQSTSPYYVLPYVIWNFPNTKTIRMINAGFRGSILAPDASALC